MPKWVAEENAKRKKEDKIVYKPKTGSNTKSQSSSASTTSSKKGSSTQSKVNEKASKSTFMGGGSSVRKTERRTSTATTRRTSAKARQVAEEQKRKREQRSARTMTPQRQTDTGTGRKATTPGKATSTAQTQAERKKNRDANLNLKQTQAAASRRRTKAALDSLAEVTKRNTAEWNSVKNKSKEEQQAWFTQKAKEAQERHAAANNRKVDKGTDNLLTSAAKAAYHSGKGAVHSLTGAIERSSMNDFYEAARFKYDAMRKGMSEEAADKFGNEKAQKRQQERLAGFRQKTKIEQEKVEAIKNREAAKDSGPIPLRKWSVGAASFTGQRLVDSALGPYSLLSMGARVLEDERNAGKEKNDQLKKKLAESGQFTKEELDEEFNKLDKRAVANAKASAGIEIISELFFGGIGLSKRYIPKGASGLLDRAAAKLTGRLTKSAAGRIALGIGEETLEEWGANPLQAKVSNALTGNRLQQLQEEGVRRAYQAQAKDLKEMHATSADINSQAFLDRAKEVYKESGATDKEATKIAELARDYFNADIIGDTKTAEEKLNQITDILAGGENDLREKWTLKDAMEVAGEMIISVGAEATPGAISTMQAGNQYKANYGMEGVRKLAKIVENLDEAKSDTARAIVDDIDKGKDISGTQVALLMEWSNDAALKAQDREIVRDQVVQRRMRDERLLIPIVDAEYNLSPLTEERFEAIVERTADIAQDEMKLNMSDVDAYGIGDVVAAFETGAISAEQMNELNIENPENRAVFKSVTGIDLDQYTVKDSKGNVKVAASNTAMQKALFAKAADNYIKSARLEQQNWNDVERGRAFEELTSNMDGMGGVGVQRVLEAVDPRNRSDFMLAGSVARRVYEQARFTNDGWDQVKHLFSRAFNTSMDANMRYVFDMAKEAKAIGETANYGKQVTAGENMKNSLGESAQVRVPGKVIDLRSDQSDKRLSDKSFFTKAATVFGVNIELVDDLPMVDKEGNVVVDEKTGKPVQVEGVQISGSNTIRVNTHQDIHRAAREIVEHELIHQIRSSAPDAFKTLANHLMENMYRADPDGFTNNIRSKQAQYAIVDPGISIEGAFEEMLANGFVEINWDQLIQDVQASSSYTTEEKASFFDSIKNAFAEILRKLRAMLSSGDVTSEPAKKALMDEILLADETYQMLLNAATAAKVTQAKQAINEKQDSMNVASDTRHSISAQQDADYMKAVEAGDMETAQRMVDEAARNAGYTVEAFHGTKANFNKFRKNSHFGSTVYQALDRLGFYNDILDEYEDDPEVEELLSRARDEENAKVMRLHIKAENPIRLRDLGSWGPEELREGLNEVGIDLPTDYKGADIVNALKDLGYDSIVYENLREGRDEDEGENDAYILFDPRQAKLADPVTYDDNGNVIPLSQRFNQESEDIRYSITPAAAEVTETDSDIRFSFAPDYNPKKTITVYKLMRLKDNGKLGPLFIDSTTDIIPGNWYLADSPNMDFLLDLDPGDYLIEGDTPITFEEYVSRKDAVIKRKHPNVQDIKDAEATGGRWVRIKESSSTATMKRYGTGKAYYNLGINGATKPQVNEYAMRPGWHAATHPSMLQIGKGPDSNLRDDAFVWTVGEMPADIDYTEEANKLPTKDIPTHIPTDGYYMKATNADKVKSQADVMGWYVAGAYKVNRIIGDLEARDIIDQWNAEHPAAKVQYDYERESGMVFDADQMKLVPKDDTRYSIRTSNDLLADRDDTAIFIKNTSKANYIDMIFSGEKTEETRARRTLDAFIGKEVAVTDGKKVYGTIVLGEPYRISAEDFHKDEYQERHRVPENDDYDVKDGKSKWSYPIESYNKYSEPLTLTDDRNYLGSYQARQVVTEERSNWSKGVFPLTGKPVSQEYKDAVEYLENGGTLGEGGFDAAWYNSLPEVKEARSRIGDAEETIKDKSPERIKLREGWVQDLMNYGSARDAFVDGKRTTVYDGIVRQDRRIDLIVGLPSSGKSSALVDPISFKYKSRLLDSDEAKKLIPEFDDGWGAGRVHEESSQLLTDAFVMSLENGDNIVMPILGKSVNSIEKRVKAARQFGYEVYVRMCDLPANKAAARNLIRFINTGRFVDLEQTSLAALNGPAESFDAVVKKGEIDGYTEVSNDVKRGQNPKFVRGEKDISYNWRDSGQRREGVLGEVRSTDEGEASGQSDEVRYSLSSISEAAGLTFSKRDGRTILTDRNGKEITEVTPAYLKKTPIGRLLLLSNTRGDGYNVMSDAAVDNRLEFLSKLYNMVIDTQDIDLIWAVSGTLGYDPMHLVDENTPQNKIKEQKSKFASITGNSDPQYKSTIDFTTICVKTQAIIDAMSALMKKLNRGLSEHEIIDIVYNETHQAGEQVPCPVCYVFSRWVGLGNLFSKIQQFQKDYPEGTDMSLIAEEYDTLQAEVGEMASSLGIKGGKARDILYRQTLERKDQLDELVYYDRATDEEKKELELIDRRLDVLDHWSWLGKTRLDPNYKEVPAEVLFDINAGREFATKYPAVWKFRTTRGPSLGKAAAPYTPSRLGDTIRGIASPGALKDIGSGSRPFLAKSTTKTARKYFDKAVMNAKRQNRMNGQRLQSTSDFRFEYGLDYLLSFLELEAIGAKAQMYTKVPEAVKFLASTGAEVNCSIMPLGRGVDTDGNLVFSDVTGMSWADALALSKAYDNVQPILVAIGPDHLIAAMADKDITMIIPYHASGSSEGRYISMMQTVGESVEDRTDFAEYENEHEIEDATPEQVLARNLRIDILTGKKEFLKPAEVKVLENNEILRQLYIRIYGMDENGNEAKPDSKYVENYDENGNDADCYGVYLTKDQAKVMMPYEYWDKTSTIKDADKQGKAYQEYCKSLGITPVFSGWDSKGRYHEDMDFSGKPGYWKTLIDRCMYNNDGSYHKQSAINLDNVDMDMLDSEMMRSEVVKPLQVNDPAKTKEIVDNSLKRIEAEKTRHSIAAKYDDEYMAAVNSKDWDKAQELVNAAAKDAGLSLQVYHGSRAWDEFTVFTKPKDNDSRYEGGAGFVFVTPGKDYAEDYAYAAHEWDDPEGFVLEGFINPDNFLDIGVIDHIAFEDNAAGLPETPSFNDDAAINSRASTDLKGVAKALNMTPYELIHAVGERVYSDIGFHENTYDLVNRPEFAQIIRDRGYRGIKTKEFGVDAYGLLDITQFKSSKPVTRADDGSVIPLSQRFDPSNEDIRYSLPTTDADGNVLTNGQMEYFKNSQARDAEGRLVPVYHATSQGGFTVFDPMRSDDHRSLFFSNKKDVANTYVERLLITGEDKLGEEELDNQEGYYQVYLNLQNPLIIQGRGQNWNSIVDGGSVIDDSANVIIKNPGWFETQAAKYDELPNSKAEANRLRAIASELEQNNKVRVEAYTGEAAGVREYDISLDNDIAQRVINDAFGFNDGDDFGYGIAEELIPELDYASYTRIDAADIRSLFLDEYGYSTREWAEIAEDEGYDGVIFKDIVDIDNRSEIDEEQAISDIYIAFSSNQVKDINNENPTENPDIRYSIVDDDEAAAYRASQFAFDNTYEALKYYEDMIRQIEGEDYEDTYLKAKKYIEKNVDKFYSGLTSFADDYRSDDPVIEDGRNTMAKSKQNYFNSVNAKWNDRWRTEGTVLEIKSVKKSVRELVMAVMQNSATDHMYKTELLNKALIDTRLAYDLAKRGREDVAYALLWHSALKMIDGVEFYQDDGTYEAYKEMRDYFRTTKISLGEEYWSDVNFGAFRKRNGFRIKLVKGNTNVDKVYQELQERWPEWFDKDEALAPPDMLLQIEHALDAAKPYKTAYSSEEAAALATDIAEDLFNIMVEGKPVESLADRYRARYDEKTKALKVRHAEAMLKVREQRDEAVRKTNEKWIVREEKRKERAAHSKAYENIQKSYNELYKRLTTNTVDKHIPEQYKQELVDLLLAFDLQSVRSKKIEAKRGYQAKKTIKLAEMRSVLKKIGNRAELFTVNDSITDIIDDLLGENDAYFSHSIEGETIDELSATELKKIDKLFKSLLHEFNNYEKIRVNTKKMQAEDLGHAQVDSCLEHRDVFGEGKDYMGLLGALDRIPNLDEVTAAYLFRRIDPNGVGMKLMFDEINRSFDHYVRNTKQLQKWMDEILGEYQNHGKGPNKYGADQIAEWRNPHSRERIYLEDGMIELTPAQMMSLYCLAKRAQAHDHMTGAGIVVAPVTYNAKNLSVLKPKAMRTNLPQRLTDYDIERIVERLTPEQINVADKLQELMATKMAAWGNEASMSVIGIKLFEDPNYFPIWSDKKALTRELNEDQFVEAIRNFGFTKAVQPGARNAIMIDDIFTIVSEHCNNMNLYNSYSESINDFMKVYNYRDFREDGSEYTVQQAIANAYSQKATTFIMQFMKDLNGNVSGSNTGIISTLNNLLGNAKKASVFANVRVLLQQPTAITRAFAEIDPIYLKSVRITPGAMKEMFEHCPRAWWKSQGYYDINMGRSVEDVMMNNGSFWDDVATGAYGWADNVTWTAIWQMCKAEVEKKNPTVKKGSDEYWELCNERMTEVVDLTQVMDSPIHRSHGMRSKDIVMKSFTSFMSEPTLTFNMMMAGYRTGIEEIKAGSTVKGLKILGRTFSVLVLQAATVSAAAALWDAVRGKNGDDDDETQNFLNLWWINCIENFKDEARIWNKVYFIKDIDSIMRGYDLNNLAIQGFKMIRDGYNQLTGAKRVYSSKTWYENLFGGIGYLTGIPAKTLIQDVKAVYHLLGVDWKLADDFGKMLDDMAKSPSEAEEKGTLASAFADIFRRGEKEADAAAAEDKEPEVKDHEAELQEYREGLSDNLSDDQKDKLVKQYKKTLEKQDVTETAMSEDFDVQAHIKEAQTNFEFEMEKRSLKAAEAAAGKTGNAKNEALWDVIADGYTKSVESGNMATIQKMKDAFVQNGGEAEWFDAKITDKMKSAYKKTIVNDPSESPGAWTRQAQMRNYMLHHGVSEEEISDIVYHSYTARDLKAAMRIGNEEYILDELIPLIQAGLTRADYEKLYKYRNYGAKSYDGKYTDPKYTKTTGTFVWPTEGVITSHFGYRNDVASVGGSTNHPAIDIGAPTGTPVSAADGGVVITAGWNGGYGNSVGIRHANGMTTYYNHLSAWSVKVGDQVAQGQPIASVGSTGRSTGPHLDFKILDADGNPVDPERYLNKRS